jgi:hypothetical protein
VQRKNDSDGLSKWYPNIEYRAFPKLIPDLATSERDSSLRIIALEMGFLRVDMAHPTDELKDGI